VDHLLAVGVFIDYFSGLKLKDITVVSPDVGGIKMARAYAKRLGADLAIIDKRRKSPDSTEVMHILGEVKGRNAIIVDDLIATGSSLFEAVQTLKEAGAKSIYAAITHGVLSGPALERLDKSNDLKELIVSDSIPIADEKKHSRIKVLSLADLLGEAIKRIHSEESVSSLFD
jgi:ribose-phosphate pyrophosphokinase